MPFKMTTIIKNKLAKSFKKNTLNYAIYYNK